MLAIVRDKNNLPQHLQLDVAFHTLLEADLAKLNNLPHLMTSSNPIYPAYSHRQLLLTFQCL